MEFVDNVINKENQRRQEEVEKENEHKLWTMYVHSMTDKSFNDWKAQVLQSSGNASIGKDADLTVIDLKKEGKFNIEEFKTKAEYSPFDGWEYQGLPVMTIVNGKTVMDKI